MIDVLVWNFRGKREAWGHAAMRVGQTYISWWPSNPGQVQSKLHPQIYESYPIRNRTYFDDVRDEGQRENHCISINGLDENAIKDWWQSFGLTRDGVEFAGPLQSWSTLDRNCSTVVANALKIGGGAKFASSWSSWNLVWTPNDVYAFALSIQQGTASLHNRS